MCESDSVVPLRYGGIGSSSEFDWQPVFLSDKLGNGTLIPQASALAWAVSIQRIKCCRP